MKPDNRRQLEALRHLLINRGGDSGADIVLRIVHEEWDPNYRCDMWCDHCKMKLIEYAFGKMAAESIDRINIDFENNPNNIDR